MVRFLADEDLPRAIVLALQRHRPEVDILRVQDVGLGGKLDPEILAWAATEGRIDSPEAWENRIEYLPL